VGPGNCEVYARGDYQVQDRGLGEYKRAVNGLEYEAWVQRPGWNVFPARRQRTHGRGYDFVWVYCFGFGLCCVSISSFITILARIPDMLGAALRGAERMITSRAPETQNIIRSFPTIMDYADKIHNHYFPDYEHWE